MKSIFSAPSPARLAMVSSIIALAVTMLSPLPGAAANRTTSRVSVGQNEAQARRDSLVPAISSGGGFVAFKSFATNLIPRDTNGVADIFLRDRSGHTTVRVSEPNGKGQANGTSYEPAISARGRFIAFSSRASNLVKGDTNRRRDVFVRDRARHKTTRVSRAYNGGEPNGSSYDPAISADGRYIAFYSSASNLVARRDTNGTRDVFVHDRLKRKTVRVSVSGKEGQGNARSYGPAISNDGQVIAFVSYASDLVPGDTNREPDVFVRYRGSGRTKRASWGGRQANGASYDPAVSGDGRYIAFKSSASNLVRRDNNREADIFVRDTVARDIARVNVSSGGKQANGDSYDPGISGGGRFISFSSWASNLVKGDTNRQRDVFVRDRFTHKTRRVSLSWKGGQANNINFGSEISSKGTHVAFWSLASNLVPRKDTNKALDAFVWGPS